jgi:hypothetical protein
LITSNHLASTTEYRLPTSTRRHRPAIPEGMLFPTYHLGFLKARSGFISLLASCSQLVIQAKDLSFTIFKVLFSFQEFFSTS